MIPEICDPGWGLHQIVCSRCRACACDGCPSCIKCTTASCSDACNCKEGDMTEENKPDPPWKAALRKSVKDAAWNADLGTFNVSLVADLEEAVMAAVLPHMETSYKSGRMAGASQAGYRLVQKNLELAKKLREVREAIDFSGAATYSLERIADILGEDSP